VLRRPIETTRVIGQVELMWGVTFSRNASIARSMPMKTAGSETSGLGMLQNTGQAALRQTPSRKEGN
jgi:hypothetical protein